MAKKTCYELLKNCRQTKFAIPAFNIDNLESAIAVTRAVKETNCPVIIQTIPKTLNYGGIATYPAMIDALMQDIPYDYAIHLDHGNSLDLVKKCINYGFSSVMYDGSALPFEENVIKTSIITEYSKQFSVSAEGELGTIGGKEESDIDSLSSCTSPNEAKLFVQKTKVDMLAIGVGTCHGIYRGTPKINVERIYQIANVVDVPLVLHGATGLDNKIVTDCIDAGISKINFATELRMAFTDGLKSGLAQNMTEFDPKIYLSTAVDAVKNAVIKKICLCYRL